MTVFATRGALDVSRGFAGRRRAVVTAGTVAADTGVIEYCTGPRAGGMTIVATVAASNMGRCLAACQAAIVAACTGADHRAVIDPRHGPTAGRMTILTGRGGLDVTGRLPSCRGTIVAAHAIAADTAVIEARCSPGRRRMTSLAIVATGNMAGSFTSRNSSVVATATVTHYRHMIDTRYLAPAIRGMAILTGVHHRHVIPRLDRRGDTTTTGMAGDAACWRALESRTHMAAFAIGAHMSTTQRKACREMIESTHCRLGCGSPDQAEKYH